MQLLCAVLLLGEHMPRERWIGFGIVWLALIVLSDRLAPRPARGADRAARATSRSTTARADPDREPSPVADRCCGWQTAG